MKILTIHNNYQQRGGEDIYFQKESELLRRNGNEVLSYTRSNKEINDFSIFKKLSIFWKQTWSQDTYEELRRIIKEFRPDIAHFHNTFFMITPSAYYACKDKGVPVVQTLHNFRLLCPNAYFLKKGKICEECLERTLWKSIQHGCYRESRILTTALARMLHYHRRKATWLETIDLYITLSQCSRSKFIQAGIPEDKIVVKPNFVYPDNGERKNDKNYVLYCGRLSTEKGLNTLIKAWENLESIPLKILGNGPLYAKIKKHIKNKKMTNVELLGHLSHNECIEYIKGASFLVMPSEWYEVFPTIIVEAFACGVPIVASKMGAMKELICDGKTGLLFQTGNTKELAEKVSWLISHKKEAYSMSIQARKEYKEKYSAENGYKILMNIYKTVVDNKNSQNLG